MALGVRLKKSLIGGRPSGRGPNSKNFDESDGRGRRPERRHLRTEKRVGRDDRDSDVRTFGRRPIGGRGGDQDSDVRPFRRRPVRDGSDGETRSRGGNFRTLRSGRGGGGRRRGEEIPMRSEVVDQLRSRGRNAGRKPRDVNEDGSEERRDGRGGDRGRSTGGSRSRRVSDPRDVNGDGSEEGRDGRGGGRGWRTGGSRSRRVSDGGERMEANGDSFEASSDKFRLKWKKMDKKRKDSEGDESVEEDARHRGKGKRKARANANEEVVVESNKTEGGGGDVVDEKKPVRRQTRVLEKSGKKIRVGQKRSDDSSAEKGAPVKKKKRVIKIDPHDISNKRLDDSPPMADHVVKGDEKDSEMSKNAQFRAIEPSPAILSFVEDNLLGRRRLKELKDAGYNIKLSAPLDNIPFSTSTERERMEENVFGNKLEFFAAAKISSSFPPPLIPEIAFAGRSNVGKSSLLNALTRQWGIVRTSDKPGLTQTINFFKLASKLCLVDLPGYGFAYAKDEVKEAWEELVKEYVTTRVGLQRVCLLVDTKWGMKPRDHELVDLMERSRTPYQIVLTKTDLVFPIDVARRAMQIQENLKKNKSIVNPMMMVSSKSGAGIRNLQSGLAKIIRFVKP